MTKECAHLKLLEDRLQQHMIAYAKDKTSDDLRHEQAMKEIAALRQATADVVNAWKVANGFQKFVKWLSGFAVLGAAITWASKHFP